MNWATVRRLSKFRYGFGPRVTATGRPEFFQAARRLPKSPRVGVHRRLVGDLAAVLLDAQPLRADEVPGVAVRGAVDAGLVVDRADVQRRTAGRRGEAGAE